MEKFRHKKICKGVVITEMVLAGISIFFGVVLFFAKLAEPPELNNTEQNWTPKELLKPKREPNVSKALLYVMQTLHFLSFVFLLVVFFMGRRVLAQATIISPQTMDIKKVHLGIRACETFCMAELLRMTLFLISFFGELLFLHAPLFLQLIWGAINLPVVFGWFFASEFRRELKNHYDELETARALSLTLCQVHQFQMDAEGLNNNEAQEQVSRHFQRQHSRDHEDEWGRRERSGSSDLAEAMMYSAPSLAYCINNLVR